jgi:hypothetical protein
MNNLSKYDPEDLESLMMHKSFEELLPEERAFVLRHISSPSEYEHLRTLLITTLSEWQSEDTLPGKHIKQNVMKEFRKQHEEKAGWRIWLNSLFSSSFDQNYSLWLGGSFAILCVFIGVYFWVLPDNQQLAVTESDTSRSEQVKELPAQNADDDIARNKEIANQAEPVALSEQIDDVQIEHLPEPEQKETAVVEEAETMSDEDYGQDEEVLADVPEAASARVYEDHSGAAASEFSLSMQTRSNSIASVAETVVQEPLVNEGLLDILYTAR